MKKYIFSFMTLLVMVLSGLLLTSCSEDDLVTNQYQKGVALNVFGPSPVVRGGTLRFLGSNLDQVAQVIIPGVDPITNIEVVQAGIPSEIRVVVPKDGPEIGKIQLIDKTGKVLTTQTELTYTEDIEFEKFTPEDVMAGQEITIIGDYLNLIHMVEFADGVQVSEKSFTQHDRYTIKVLVPEEAQTGKIKLYDVDLTVQDPDAEDVSYNIVQSEKVLHVGTPTITKIKGRAETAAQGTITAKQGEIITISGSYMNLVTGVKIGGVEALEVEVAQDGKSVTAKLPAEAPDGEIALVCKSGVEVPVGTLTTIAPTELKVEAAAVKAGTTLTVTGKDLDVVTSVSFPNAGQVSEIEVSATSLSVNVPTKAQEGELTLSMANGKTVSTTYALVKPTAISYNSNPASAGSSLVITGTDLDLITSVAFGASIQKNVEANADGTALTVKIPLDGESGKPVLSLDNGTSIEAPELTVDKPAFCYVPDPTLLTDNDLKAGDLLIIEVENIDVLTGVQIDGEDTNFLNNGNKLYVSITANAGTKSVLKLISDGIGEVEYALSVVPNTEKHTIIWTGTMQFMDWNGNQDLAYGAFDWSQIVPGTEMIIHATVVDPLVGWGCVSVRHGNGWSNVAGLPNQYDFSVEEADITIVVELTQEVLDDLCSNDGMIIMGHNFILSSIELVEHISLETVIAQGEFGVGALDNSDWDARNIDNGYDWSQAEAGQLLRIYAKRDPGTTDYNNFKIMDPWWSYQSDGLFFTEEGIEDNESTTRVEEKTFELTLTSDMITFFRDHGGLCAAGHGVIVTKVTIQ